MHMVLYVLEVSYLGFTFMITTMSYGTVGAFCFLYIFNLRRQTVLCKINVHCRQG